VTKEPTEATTRRQSESSHVIVSPRRERHATGADHETHWAETGAGEAGNKLLNSSNLPTYNA
jgi:hypothetical protein